LDTIVYNYKTNFNIIFNNKQIKEIPFINDYMVNIQNSHPLYINKNNNDNELNGIIDYDLYFKAKKLKVNETVELEYAPVLKKNNK